MLTKIYLISVTLSYLFVCHIFLWGFSQNDMISHFVAIFYIYKDVKKNINLEYYIVFNLQSVKKWLIYFKFYGN